MRALSVFLGLALGGCARTPAASPPPVEHATIAPVIAPAVALVAPRADPPARVVARNVTATWRLGATLVIATVDDPAHAPSFHVARVGEDDALEELAKGMPGSQKTMSRVGHEVISGAPSALLGEARGTIWMAWAHYSVFGNATMYRATPAGWAETHAAPWTNAITTRLPSGERVPSGDVVALGSRGHLFKVKNRVSGEGAWYRLAREGKLIEALDDAYVAAELANGDVVLARSDTPGRAHLVLVGAKTKRERDVDVDAWRPFDGTSADDLWFQEETGLAHVEGDVITRVAFPTKDGGAPLVADDGVVWIGGRGAVYAYASGAWQSVRLPEPTSFGEVVAAREHVAWVLAGSTLLRFER